MFAKSVDFISLHTRSESSRPKGPSGSPSFQKALQNAADTALRPADLASVARLQALRCAISFDDSPGSEESGFGHLINGMLTNHLRASQKYGMMSGNCPTPVERAAGSFNLTEKNGSEPVDRIIGRASRQFGIAPNVIKAVIRAESNFDPQAVSPAGAQGLMQLMPGTAEEMGVKDSFHPEQNIMGGSRYLRQMLDRYDGDLDRALAAYNWGPGNLDRSTGELPRETRTYLRRIRKYLDQGAG